MSLRLVACLFLTWSIFLLLPFLIDPMIFKKNDLDGNVASFIYIKQSLITYHTYPQWIPYINQGIPIIADPINEFMYPMVGLSYLILPYFFAEKIIYLGSVFFSLFTFYIVCRYVKISTLLSILFSCIYTTSGYLVSRILIGHSEKVMTYALLPLFLLSILILSQKKSIHTVMWTSVLFVLFLLSGDMYNLLYSLILFFVAFLYTLYKKPSIAYQYILTILLFLGFGAFRIFPLIELQKYITKQKDPFSGSANITSSIYYLFFPIKKFFTVIGLQKNIITAYGWWEKIAYIGPLAPIIFILYFTTKQKVKDIKYLPLILLLLCTMFCLLTPVLWYNPYKYILLLFPTLNYFHVPTRAFSYIILFLLFISAQMAQILYKRKGLLSKIIIIICIMNLASEIIFFEGTYILKQLPSINTNFATVLAKLPRHPTNPTYITGSVATGQLPQYATTQNHQLVLESDYGLQLQHSPAIPFTTFDFTQKGTYTDIRPEFEIVDAHSHRPILKDSYLYLHYKNVTVYKLRNPTPFAVLNDNNSKNLIQKTTIGIDKITIQAITGKDNTLTLQESYYPGWTATIDGKKSVLKRYRFLQIQTTPGKHIYVFSFISQTFIHGVLLSLSTIVIIVCFFLL